MTKHEFKCLDTEQYEIVIGMARERGLSFYAIDKSLQVVVTSDMNDADYAAVWAALNGYNVQPDALPLP